MSKNQSLKKKLMAKDIFATSYIYLSGPEKVYLYLTTTK